MRATYAVDPCEVEEVDGVADFHVRVDRVDPAREEWRHCAEDREDRAPVLGAALVAGPPTGDLQGAHAAVGIAIPPVGPVHGRYVHLALMQEPVLISPLLTDEHK